MSTPLSVSDIVARFSQLKQLTDRARGLGELNARLLGCIPGGLAQHVRLATIRDGCLVLQAEGTTWAAQLRFQTPEILERLKDLPEFGTVKSVRVRNVVEPREKTRTLERRHMSRAAAEALEAEARCTDDPRLRAALRRLARHAKD